MEIDWIEIGPSPYGEDCAQLGSDNYRERATKEMNAFINQLYRAFPEIENTNLLIKKKWNNHDFGVYGDVVIQYFVDDHDAVRLAYEIEANTPEFWDEEALKELGK